MRRDRNIHTLLVGIENGKCKSGKAAAENQLSVPQNVKHGVTI